MSGTRRELALLRTRWSAHWWSGTTVAAGDEVRAAVNVRVLLDGFSGGAPATRRGSGGRCGDGELGGVLHDDAAATTAAQFDGDETRPKTLDGEMRRRKGSGGEMGGGSGIRGCWRSSGSYL